MRREISTECVIGGGGRVHLDILGSNRVDGATGSGSGHRPVSSRTDTPLANGKPDMTGLWAEPYTPNMAGRGSSSVVDPLNREPLDWEGKGDPLPDAVDTNRTNDLPYTELGLQRWKEYDPVTNGDYAGSCMPFGMARNINSPHGSFIIAHEDAIAILFEQNTWFHLIPIGGAWEWPQDLAPAWNGYSVAEWDGDTLVVRTTNFNGYTPSR